MARLIASESVQTEINCRRLYFMSLEYAMGSMLGQHLCNLRLTVAMEEALRQLGIDPLAVAEAEAPMGLGAGELGSTAASLMESTATLDLPAVGYGVFYEFGWFRQRIVNGRQVELPDHWQQFPNPWEIARPEHQVEVEVYGRVERHLDDRGEYRARWVDTRYLLAIPHDIPIAGYGATTVNFLRLWESRASQEFDLNVFNRGGYVEAVREKAIGETITKVLYPNDESESGRELRLVQQYLFAACSLKDIIRGYRKTNRGWQSFPDKVAIQLNDTHAGLAIAELMRILVDEEGLPWERAWDLCRRVFSYTNHTLLPETLERWSVPLFEQVLPRHLEIIYEINLRFLEQEVTPRWPGDVGKLSSLSLIEESCPKQIRMAHVSLVGSHTVNGIEALHTQLLQERIFADFYALYPQRFQNTTNGITPRRWLKQCNPRLSQLIDETVGDHWPVALEELRRLERQADDSEFQRRFLEIKRQNKVDLAGLIERCTGVKVDAHALFDVQIGGLHEYQRLHLNLLHILTLYRRLLHDPDIDMVPRAFVFGAKAPTAHELSKRVIHAINAVAAKINADPRTRDKLKVVFLPDYSVTLAERIIPAAEVSEQISTAGREASAADGMKLALNGAVTIGTLAGTTIDILEEVGSANIFIFGNTMQQLDELGAQGYSPWEYYRRNTELRAAVDWLSSGFFAEREALGPVVRSLLDGGDPFFVLADYEAYVRAQEEIDRAYRDRTRWARMAILNTARLGRLSSDRMVREYARDIWNLLPLRPPGPLDSFVPIDSSASVADQSRPQPAEATSSTAPHGAPSRPEPAPTSPSSVAERSPSRPVPASDARSAQQERPGRPGDPKAQPESVMERQVLVSPQPERLDPATSEDSFRWHIFIAHASNNTALAEQLYASLSPRFRVFLASKSLLPGDRWTRRLPEEQRASQVTVVLVSPHTNDAYYQSEEIVNAIETSRGADSSRRTVPVVFAEADLPYGLKGLHSIKVRSDENLATVAEQLRQLFPRLNQGYSPYPKSMVDELDVLTQQRRNAPRGETPLEAQDRQDRIDRLSAELRKVPSPREGDVVVGAKLVRMIGKGSFGSVWQAQCCRTSEPRAIKIFDPDRLSLELALNHFRRGVRAMVHLNSVPKRPTTICRLFEVDAPALAFSMAYSEGGDLENVARWGFSLERKRAMFREVALAVQFAHENGVLHRDIKPANIVLSRDGVPVLTDFDIADLLFATRQSAQAPGSMLYTAPEQLTGARRHDASGDVYSLGRLLQYLLSEQNPPLLFEGEPKLADLEGQPEALVQLVRKATMLDPRARFASVSDMISALT
jgi:starch phosphorylase